MTVEASSPQRSGLGTGAPAAVRSTKHAPSMWERGGPTETAAPVTAGSSEAGWEASFCTALHGPLRRLSSGVHEHQTGRMTLEIRT